MSTVFDTAKLAQPMRFRDHAKQIDTGENALKAVRKTYETTVSGLATSWQGLDYQGLEKRAKIVGENIQDAERRFKDASTTLEEHAPILEDLKQAMLRTEQQARTQLYAVAMGKAALSPVQIARANALLSAPPPGGEAAYAAEMARLTAGMIAFTTAMTTEHMNLIFQDLACAARMHSIGLLLQRVSAVLGTDSARRPTTVPVRQDPAQRPGTFRRQTMIDAAARTQQNPPGTLRDHQDGTDIGTVGPGGFPTRNPANPFDVGHPYGRESARHEEAARLWGANRRDVNNFHNSAPYVLESQPTNRSHGSQAPMTTNKWIEDYYKKYGPPPMPRI